MSQKQGLPALRRVNSSVAFRYRLLNLLFKCKKAHSGVAGTMRTAAGTTRARSARALRTTSAGTMRTAAGTTRARSSARCARLARRGRTPRRRRPRGSAPRRSHSRQRAVRQRGRHPPSGHALRPRWRPLRRVRGRRRLHRRHRTAAGTCVGGQSTPFGAIEHLLY